jgi:hypothetical protein
VIHKRFIILKGNAKWQRLLEFNGGRWFWHRWVR